MGERGFTQEDFGSGTEAAGYWKRKWSIRMLKEEVKQKALGRAFILRKGVILFPVPYYGLIPVR